MVEPVAAADATPAEDLVDLYENAPCGYLSARPDGRIVKANATLATMLGYPPGRLAGKSLYDLLSAGGGMFHETHIAPLLRMQGFVNEVALELLTVGGARLPVLVNFAEKRDAEGRHVLTRMTIFNAPDRRRYEHELLNARTRAETAQYELRQLNEAGGANLRSERAASALREQFIAVLGHDLRSPLAAVESGMRMLLNTPLDGEAAEVVAMVRACVARMFGLVDNVMDFARGRLGGGLSLERNAAEPLEPVLGQVVDELRISAPARQIDSHFAIDSPVDCDRRRVAQLASNLLSNALIHGGSDTPVRISAVTSGGWFELSVANGGKPIAQAMLERIFEPFSRDADRPNARGLGLGLFIAHEIASAHRGTLDVVSNAAETRFTFRMPLTA